MTKLKSSSTRPDICMIVHNPLIHDARVIREAESLVRHGFSVVVVSICLDIHDLPSEEVVKGFKILRVFLPQWYLHVSRFICKPLQKKTNHLDNEDIAESDQVILLKSKSKTSSNIFDNIRVLVIKVIELFLNEKGLIAKQILFLKGASASRKVNALLYHAHDFPALMHLAISGIWRKPIVYDSHEIFFEQWYPDPIPIIYRNLRPYEKFLAKRASKVITVGECVADHLCSTLEIERPTVVFNAVDLRSLESSGVIFPTNGRISIVHSGMITIGRHLPELVKSLTFLPSDVVLVLMGQGFLEDALKQQAINLKVSDRLLIVPPVKPNEVCLTLSQADVGAVMITTKSLQYNYSMPNKLFECIAAGLPLVTSNSREIAELIRKYDLGLVCDPTQPKEIASTILKVLEPDKLKQYAANVCEVRDRFLNWENEEKKLIALYQTLLSRN